MRKVYPGVFNKSRVFLFALSFLLLPAAMLFAQPVVTTYSTPGTYTFTVLAGVNSVKVEAWGGGGAGGGVSPNGFSSTTHRGSGGGGGAFKGQTFTVTPGQTYTIVVGGGGIGVNDGVGGGGAASSFTGNTITIIANPGGGGLKNGGDAGIGGIGGTGGYNGGNGNKATSGNGGGGGGAAGNGGNGGNGANSAGGAGGGGATPGGKGGNGAGSGTNDGAAGTFVGGGGGGARNSGLFADQKAGGNGAAGQVIISYTIIPNPTITSFTPTSACIGATPTVTITGTNFTGSTAVKFNGVNATSFNVVSATSITAVLPATGVTTGPISVTSPDGTGISTTDFIINTSPTITGQPSTGTQFRCVGVAANPLTVTASGTNPTYQWYSNTTEYNTGGTSMGTTNGARTASFTPPTGTAGTLYYYVVVSGTCAPPVTSNVSGAITVNPLPIAGTIIGASGVCVGSNTTLSPNATGAGTLTYTWNSSNTAVATVTNTGVVTGVGEGTANITYTVSDGNTCVATSANFAFRVSPSAGAITSAGNVVGACAGNTVAMTPHASGVGPFTYTWNSTNTAVATVSGTGVVSALSLGTTNITYTVTDGNGCTATSPNFAFSVTVPTANNITGPTQVCAESTIALASHGTGDGTLTYTWASSNTAVATVSTTGVVSGVSAGTTDITYTVKDGNGCTATSSVYPITVNPRPLTATGATGGSTCGTGPVTISVDAPGAGLTIDWFTVATGGTAVASGNNTYTTPNISANTNYYAQVRNTTTGCVSATRLLVTATFNALPGTPGAGTGASTCGPGSVTISVPNATGITVDWYAATSGGTLLASGNSFTTPVISTTTIYYAEARNTSSECTSTSRRAVTATVNTVPPAPSPTSSNGTLEGGVYTRCENIIISATGSGGNVYFQGTDPNATVTNLGSGANRTITVSGTYYYRTRSSSTGNCWSDAVSITVVVNPLPAVTTVVGGGEFCGSTVITATGGVGGTIYFQGKTSNGTSTTTLSSSETVTSSGTYYFRSLSAEGCWGPQGSAVIVIKPVPTGTFSFSENSGIAPNDNIICLGSTVVFTAPAGYGSYIFKSGTTVLQSGTAHIFSASNLPLGLSSITVDVANSVNCGTTFGPIDITVTPLPTPTLTPTNATICPGEEITFTATGGTAYNFKVNNATVQSGALATLTRDNWTNGDVVTVEVTNANKCTATSSPVTVTVNSLATGTFTSTASPSNSICEGENVTFTATGGTQYQFSVNSVVVQGFSPTATFSSLTLTNPSVVVVEVMNASGCITTYPAIAINVNPLPTGTIVVTENSGEPNDNSICANAPVTYTFPTGYKNYDFRVNGVTDQSSSSNTYINTTLEAGDIVTLIVQSNSNCEVTFTATLVTIVPSPVGTLTASDIAICSEENVTFTATYDANNKNYNFLINNVPASTGTSNIFTTNILEDGDVVTVEVTNTNDCITTFNPITMSVTALPTGTMTIAETSGVANDDGTICAGAEVIFTAPEGFANYNFLLNGASIQNGSSAIYSSITLVSGNKVTVAVTNAGGCVALLNEFTMTVNPLPTVAAITGAAEVCVESNITLANATSGGTWSSSDEAIATVDENSGVVTGVSDGDVDILYTVWNTTTNCSNTATKSITVNALPVVAAIAGDLNVCIGSTTSLSNATAGGVWSSDALGIATIDVNGNVTGVANGTANISYTVSNASECVTVITVEMTVNALPEVTPIMGKLDVCINATTTLTSTPTGGAWTSSDPSIFTVVSSTGVVTGISDGTATVTYTYSDGNSCVSTVTEEVVVNPLPVPTLDGPNPICLGSTDNVYSTEIGQFNYSWNIVNGTISAGGTDTDPTVTISWLNAGIKSISVNYEDANGCKGATVATVENAPGSSPTVTGLTAVCLNSTETYTTQTGKIDYDWSVTGGTISAGGTATDNTATILWTSVGNRSVTVNYAEPGGCSAASPTVYSVSVKPLPTATISLNTANVCETGTNPTITFKGSGSVAPYTFTYEINGGPEQTVVSTGSNATVTVPTNITGIFIYTLLSVQDESPTACAQPQSGSVTVTVTPTPSAAIEYTASPVCKSSGPISVTHTGTEGGAYIASPGGLTIDATTGEIDPATSTAGTYTVTYHVAAAGGCSVYNTTTSVTITTAPSATISYNTPFCISATTANVTHTGTIGGIYSSTTGLSIDGSTGEITPSTSTPGTYTITYTIAATGGCAEVTATTVVNITVAPAATIVYSASPYCIGTGTASVTRTGTPGGTYAATPTGLSIDANTGDINLASSTSGTYTVSYSVDAAGGCGAISSQATIVINAAPTAVAGTTAVLTCANTGAVNITSGSDATNYSSVLWTSSGSGTISNGSSLTEATYLPSAADITAGSVTLTLTAIGEAGCGSVTSTKTLTINAVPSQFIITPPGATLCLGDVQSLLATGSTPTTGSKNAGSGNIDLPIEDASRFLFWTTSGETSHSINMSVVPSNAVVNSIDVKFNISHSNDNDLVLNLRAPNGRIINLVNRKGGSGNNFINTIISSNGTNSVSSSAPPFTGTFYADAGGNGTGYPSSNTTLFASLFGTPNGTWTFGMEDVNRGDAGTLHNWDITINYTLPNSPIDVVWSPVTDLFSDASLSTPYTGEPLSVVYSQPSSSGTKTYTASISNASNCTTEETVVLIVNDAPQVSLIADYCAVGGKVTLTATSVPGATFIWSTGETGNTIQVDESGVYEVIVNVSGFTCPGKASIGVSRELVVNGNFEQGNVGFETPPLNGNQYEYRADVAGNTELRPEGLYGIGPNPQNYHSNFWGSDHTTGSGNFMIVNGFPNGAPQPVVWQQTVDVLPNTTYYFSAWAMSLNDAGPFARLRFDVNGTQVGTTAFLVAGVNNNSNNGWVRFYGTMTTGSTVTSAVISIVDLQTSPGGNDFGLDDISFGTLNTFITLESEPETDAQTICKNSPIETILYSIGNGGTGNPTVEGLPDGVTWVFSGDKLTITGTPTVGGDITYTIKTAGATQECPGSTATGTITVEEQKIDFTSGTITPVCKGEVMPDRVYTLSGTATDATVSGLPDGVDGDLSGDGITFTISGTPTVGGTFSYTITTSGTCEATTITGSITVQEQTITLNSAASTIDQIVCINTAITNIQYKTGGTATGATVTGLPAGVTGNYVGGFFTITGKPTVSGTFNYTVTTSGNCGLATEEGTIFVTPAASIVLTSGQGTDAQEACNNTPIIPITYAVSNATGASITGGNLPIGFTGSFSDGVFTISGSTAQTGSFNYIVTTSGDCANATLSGTITVSGQKIVLSSGGASPSVCAGAAMADIVYTISGEATAASISGQPAGVIGTLTGNIFTVNGIPTAVAGPYEYTITTTGPNCTPVFLTGIITVQPAAVGGTISSVAICRGDNVSMTVLNSSGTINWQVSTDGGGSWNNTNPLRTGISQTFNNVTSPSQYRVEASNTCGTKNSSVSTVAIHNYWTGAGADNNWNTASNWSANVVANTGCPITYIPSTGNQPIINSNIANIGSLFIDAGATLTVQTNGIMHIAGDITKDVTAIFNAENGTLEFNGTTAQTVSGNIFQNRTIENLIVSNSSLTSGTTQGGDNLNITGTLSFGTSTTNSVFNANQNLTLKSTASHTANVDKILGAGNKITDSVTVERYLPVLRKAWHLLAPNTLGNTIQAAWQEGQQTISPTDVKDLPLGYGTNINGEMKDWDQHGFDQPKATLPAMKYYDYSGAGKYVGVPSTSAPGSWNDQLGYFIFIRGDRSVILPNQPVTSTTLRSKGILFQPNLNGAAPRSLLTPLPPDKYIIVGNPYASAIDFFKLGLAGLQGSYEIWDPNGNNSAVNQFGTGIFRTITLNGNQLLASPAGGIYSGNNIPNIQSGEAFMVQAMPNAYGSINFTEDAKISESSNDPFFTKPGQSANSYARSSVAASAKLWATLYSNKSGRQLADGVLNMYSDEYSNDYDMWDASKMPNSSENMGIESNGRILAIERRQMPTEKDTIQYNMDDWKIQNYQFAFTTEDMQGSGVQPYLNDRYLNKQTLIDLNDTTWVDFSIVNIPGSWALNRFYVTFKPAGVLPVSLLDLTATPKNANVEVGWKTENEVNVKEYEVEKSSDARLFKKIATSPSTQKGGDIYKWLDENAVMGWNYYRIRTIDNDGKFTLSSVVKTYVQTKPGLITVAPNPVIDGKINLYLKNEIPGTYWVRLLNALGQPMLSKKISHAGGTNVYLINSDFKIAKEIYQLEVTRPDGSIQVIKIVF